MFQSGFCKHCIVKRARELSQRSIKSVVERIQEFLQRSIKSVLTSNQKNGQETQATKCYYPHHPTQKPPTPSHPKHTPRTNTNSRKHSRDVNATWSTRSALGEPQRWRVLRYVMLFYVISCYTIVIILYLYLGLFVYIYDAALPGPPPPPNGYGYTGAMFPTPLWAGGVVVVVVASRSE